MISLQLISYVILFFFSSPFPLPFLFVSNKRNLKNFDKPKEISVRHCTQFHLNSTFDTTNFNYYIQFGLGRTVKSPFEPSNRSSPVFLQALRTAFLPADPNILEIVVCCFCGLSATLLSFRIFQCATGRLRHPGWLKIFLIFSARTIAMTMHLVKFLFT